MKDLEIYCVSNKTLDFLSNTNYEIGWVGKEKAPKNYLTCDSGDNIFYKEKYYSELTFQYWFWKNKLDLEKKKLDWFLSEKKVLDKKRKKYIRNKSFKY